MSTYDENLYDNAFFQAFLENQKSLLLNVIKKKWILAIPREKSFQKAKYNDMDYLNHVLVLFNEQENEKTNNERNYKTLGNQKVIIRKKTLILVSKENDLKREIQILFDETFYENDGAYQVLCVNEPLSMFSQDPEEKPRRKEADKVFSLDSVEECTNFLWSFIAKPPTRTKVEEMITLSRSKIQTHDPMNLETCFMLMRNLYVASYNIITSHKTYTRISSKNENIQNSLKLALEMYLCHQLSSTLFWALTDVTAEKDCEVNMASRRSQYVQASKSGIRFDVCENIPRARKELANIRFCTTPIGISECLRKVIAELSHLKQPTKIVKPNKDNESEPVSSSSINQSQLKKTMLMVTSDDLLSALVFLILKSDIPNWFAYLEFAIKFRFASCSRDDEYQYYLTTLEAALEHIRSLQSPSDESELFGQQQNQEDNENADGRETSRSNWTHILDSSDNDHSEQVVGSGRLGVAALYQLRQTKHLFQLIESGQTIAVRDMLQRIQASSMSIHNTPSLLSRPTVGPSHFFQNNPTKINSAYHKCHPLCSCRTGIGATQSLIEMGRQSESSISLVPGSKTFDETVGKHHGYNRLSNVPKLNSIKCDDSGLVEVDDEEKSTISNGSSISTPTSANKPCFTLSAQLSVDDKGWSALHVAAWTGKLDIMQLILENLSQSNGTHASNAINVGELNLITLDTGETALHLAVRQGHHDVAARLLEAGASQVIKSMIGGGQTPLHIAAELGYMSCISILTYYATRNTEVILNIQNSAGNTAIHIAAMWGYVNIVNSLMDCKASLLIENKKGQRAFELASTRSLIRKLKIRAMQAEKTQVINQRSNKSGQTNTLPANKHDSPYMAPFKKLTSSSKTASGISKQANSGSIPKKSKQRLDKWSNKTNASISEIKSKTLTLSGTSDLEQQLQYERKIEKVLKVVADGDLQMLQFLLEIREDDFRSESPPPVDIQRKLCHPLCQCNLCAPVQKIIIKSNSRVLNVNSANKEGFHCLHIAAIHDRSTIAKFLLRYGANLNATTNKMKLNPLHLAAIYGSIKVLSILLDQNQVNINIQDHKLNTPLYYACSKGKSEAVEVLLKNDASMKIVNNHGNSPLHEAVRLNFTEIVWLLLDKAVDSSTITQLELLSMTNKKGLTPVDMAKNINLFFQLKKLVKSLQPHSTTDDCVDSNPIEFVTVNTASFIQEFENDVISVCSETSSFFPENNEDGESDSNISEDRPLFDDEDSLHTQPINILDPEDPTIHNTNNQSYLANHHLDNSLLERIDSNSTKYNYRLAFRDPNSPSVSSTCSSSNTNQ